uniref:Uncharacterized protein n=1 Tax=Nomascus leucogenys TaxID=61853 RepID=A0A2I3FX02_NOMLE
MWTPGGPPGPAGWDRRRLGARLRAAFQQLEAALAALQEQLVRTGRRDSGLRGVRWQLATIPFPWQLPTFHAAGASCTSDSAASTRCFYEMSDGGSCSLSTSCASVCSDHISPSLGSLLPVAQAHKARPSMGDWRPRSVDETTVPAWRPQATEEGARPPGSVEDAGQPWGTFWPRPVSTEPCNAPGEPDVHAPPTGCTSSSLTDVGSGLRGECCQLPFCSMNTSSKTKLSRISRQQ